MNIRIKIAEAYRRELLAVDENFARWVRTAGMMQQLAEAVEPHAEAVGIGAFAKHEWPKIIVFCGDAAKKSAAVRAVQAFAAGSAWEHTAGFGGCITLLHPDTALRLDVCIRTEEDLPAS